MKITLTNEDRADWIDNDEGLYNWWRAVRISKRDFIRLNRESIDAHIFAILNQKPRS